MKKILILGLVLLIAGNAFAIKKKKVGVVDRGPEIGWYLSPVAKFGEVADRNRVFGGIRGGLTVDRTFFLGAAVYGAPGDVEDWRWDSHGPDWLEIGYGGVEFGIMSSSARLANMSVGILLGGGSVQDYYWPGYYLYDGFFVAEPSVDLTFKVTRS
jgi:hypothetical protein